MWRYGAIFVRLWSHSYFCPYSLFSFLLNSDGCNDSHRLPSDRIFRAHGDILYDYAQKGPTRDCHVDEVSQWVRVEESKRQTDIVCTVISHESQNREICCSREDRSLLFAMFDLLPLPFSFSAFFWLLALVVSSLFWAAIPPLKNSSHGWAIIPVGVITQEIARAIFVRLYLSGIQQWADAVHACWTTLSEPLSGNQSLTVFSMCAACFLNICSRSERSFSVVSINAIVFPLIDLYSAIAAGVGFGAIHTFMYYATIIAHSVGDGTLYSAHCPQISTFFSAAWMALFFNIMHIGWMVIAFDAYRRLNFFKVGLIFLLHAGATAAVRRTCKQRRHGRGRY